MWNKQGLIFNVGGDDWWNKTHVQCPILNIHNDKEWRIYYATRDFEGKSRISYILVEPGNPKKILYVHDKPILELGNPGTFDDSGQMPTSIVHYKGVFYLYYIGWITRKTVPYSNAIGLAYSKNGYTFKKYDGPIFTQNVVDPYFLGTACVIPPARGYPFWNMHYLSCTEWQEIDGKMEPRYLIKHAVSEDGLRWENNYNIKSIKYKNDNEMGICSASVIPQYNDNPDFKVIISQQMWYCYRGKNYRKDNNDSYRIGYACSESPEYGWVRKDDEVGIDVSESGWDSEMICYPNVTKYNNVLYMLYNGNGFGRSGFGYATKEL